MKYIIEVLDARDNPVGKENDWSFWAALADATQLGTELAFLLQVYCREHPIKEVRIRIEK